MVGVDRMKVKTGDFPGGPVAKNLTCNARNSGSILDWGTKILYAYVLSCFSCVRLCVTLWTVARQTHLSMGFSRQEYWSELPCPPPGDLPNWGINLASLMSPALAGTFFTTRATWKAPRSYLHAMEQLSPSATSTEPSCSRACVPQPKIPSDASKILSATTKTRHSKINKYF